MADLSVNYLGLRLRNPILAAASPLSGNVDNVAAMEKAGAGAVVLPSLFEEQILKPRRDSRGALPDMRPYNGGPAEYLKLVKRCKRRVGIPIIASLNGFTDGPWLDFAAKIEAAGADALEFNAYFLADYPLMTGPRIEANVCEIVAGLASRVKIPLAVKLHPFYSSLPDMAMRLQIAGARGLVLFNRFYYPDFEPAAAKERPALFMSDPTELSLRLRWTAIMSGWLAADIAVTGGVHSPEDVVKSLLVGGRAVQCASSLFMNGIDHLSVLRDGVEEWLESRKEPSLAGLIGRLARERSSDDPGERRAYLDVMRAYALTR